MMNPARLLLCASCILLAGNDCYDEDDYTLSTEAVANAVRLTTTDADSAISADGFSRITIEAQIDPSARDNNRVVVFSTTAGTLIGGAGQPAGPQEVTADARGIAAITLVSSPTVQVARVQAQIKGAPGYADQMDVRFVSAVADSVLRFAAVPTEVPADGASTRTVSVEVSPNLPVASRKVTLRTQVGTFVATNTASVEVEADLGTRRASAELRAPSQPSGNRITATAAGFSRDTLMQFTAALPDTILVTAQPLVAKVGSAVTVKARLLRAMGTVSRNTFVFFEAADSLGGSPGQFRDVQPTNEAGEATAIYEPTGITSRRTVTIRARINNSVARGSTTIIVEP